MRFRYDGDHVCVYIRGFEEAFQACDAQGLTYVNPRFTFLDESRTLEEARKWRAFRVLHTGLDASGRPLFTEEHEIRSGRHKFLSLPSELRG